MYRISAIDDIKPELRIDNRYWLFKRFPNQRYFTKPFDILTSGSRQKPLDCHLVKHSFVTTSPASAFHVTEGELYLIAATGQYTARGAISFQLLLLCLTTRDFASPPLARTHLSGEPRVLWHGGRGRLSGGCVGSRSALFAGDSASLCRDHGHPEDANRRGGQRKLIGGAGQ